MESGRNEVKFTNTLLSEIKGIQNKVLQNPFVQEQTQGTLAKDKFDFYLQQDAYFLIDLARAYSLTAAKAEDLNSLNFLSETANETIKIEHQLHENLFKLNDIKQNQQKSPTCLAFTSYLVATAATKSFAECMAMLLTQEWVYQETSQYMYKNSKPNNPYQTWIDTYKAEEYHQMIKNYIHITEMAASRASCEERDSMLEHAIITARYEWEFWNSCYHKETWSIE